MCDKFKAVRQWKGLLATLLILLTVTGLQAQHRKTVNDLVQEKLSEGVPFADTHLFEKTRVNNKRDQYEERVLLNLDRATLNRLYKQQKPGLRLQVPFTHGEVMALDLVRVNILTDDFTLTTSEGAEVDYQPGLYYRGIIQGEENSIVALSLFENEMIATLSSPQRGDLSLGPMDRNQLRAKNTGADNYVFHRVGNFLTESGFECYTEEPENYSSAIAGADLQENQSLVANCVRMYFECDYTMYQQNGSSTSQTTNRLTSIFNAVATIYANESITLTMHQVKVWTSPDPYSDSSSSTALNQFQGTSHNADLAHLVARGGSGLGGVAWVDVICSSSYGYAYSNINGSYQPYPNYSWDVGVVTHEIGHNLGSPHTHSCSWSGGALDNCYTTEGGCSPGPAPPSSGGTIMSYCHLTSYGINLAAGFGTQPGNLIRNRVNAASCLTTCSTSTGCSGTQTLTSPTGSFDDGSGSSNYDNNQNCSWLIQPSGAGSVTLSFSSFNTENNYDFVRVYDGSSTSATLLGQYSGTSTPSSLTSSGGAMLVNFTSDYSVTAPGFAASYTSGTGGGCTTVNLDITLDNYGSETTWEIKNSGGTVVASGGPYQNNANGQVVNESACLNSGSYTLIIYDSYGDGICCGYGNGSYQLSINGQVLASGGQFGSSETSSFQVP